LPREPNIFTGKNIMDDDTEDVVDLPEEEKEQDDLLFARISRWIDGQLCSGVVADVCVGGVSGERLYFIQYLDSDVEHLTEKEVREGFVLWATQGSEMDASADPSAKESLSVNDEAIESLSPHEMERDDLLMARVTKKIDGQAFCGTIVDVGVGIKTSERLYLIKYLDGDCEHVTENEARTAIAAWVLPDEDMQVGEGVVDNAGTSDSHSESMR